MAPPGIVFLMYHELEVPRRPISQNEPGYVRYILTEYSFRAQMDWLARKGWRGLSAGQALTFPAGNSVAITFDDGCETDLITAAPILKEHGFNATFYITVGFVGRPGYMTPAQVKQLSSFGFEIGCHSMTHAYLDDLDQTGLRREVADAGKKLEDMIGDKVSHFSCPGGRYSNEVVNLVREAGYRSLATSRAQMNTAMTNPFLLGRVAVMRNLRTINFAQLCSGRNLWQMRLSESLRGTAKRVMGNTIYDRFRAFLLKRP